MGNGVLFAAFPRGSWNHRITDLVLRKLTTDVVCLFWFREMSVKLRESESWPDVDV